MYASKEDAFCVFVRSSWRGTGAAGATNAASASTCHLEGSAALSSADRRAVGGWWHGAFGA